MFLYIWRGTQLPPRQQNNAVLIVASNCYAARKLWRGDPALVDDMPDHVYALQDDWPARVQQIEFGPLVWADYDTSE